MSIGHKGMMCASQGLAATAVDLFEKPDVREALRRQFDEQTKGVAVPVARAGWAAALALD